VVAVVSFRVQHGPMRSADANKDLVRRIYERGYTLGEEAAFRDAYTDDFVHHGKTPDDPAIGGSAGQIASMKRFREAVPDARFTVCDLVAEHDLVAARLAITGTAVAGFGPVTPTGELHEIRAMVLFRFEHDRIAEEWFFTDPID
jgi:predicted ester cyclase